jgi:NAD+ synthase (glutamine-hydrolysing)
MRIALAQTNPVTGDLEGNTKQIVEYIRKAKKEKADIVIFPETAITGYCCGALYEQEDFIEGNKKMLQEAIAQEAEGIVVVVGFVDLKGRRKNGFMKITNSCAVLQNKKVVHVYDKMLLANDDHHEDRKYFAPGEKVSVAEVVLHGKKTKIGTPICEDAWLRDHDRDIVQMMKNLGAEIILCPNQSYFYYGKQKLRYSMFSEQAKTKNIPFIALNAVGVGDIVKNIMIYDGGSMAFDSSGQLIKELKRFAYDFATIDVDLKKQGQAIVFNELTKNQEIYDALIFEQKEIFRVIGIPNAQVHMSGGIDSAIVGCIVAKAMGKEHTIFISNPTNDNGEITRSNAQYIADALGIKLYWNSTQGPYEAVVKEHKKAFGSLPSNTGLAGMQAILRTVQGLAACHQFSSGIVATGNHTEIVLGWATFHDIGSIGVHAPIGDLTKMEIFSLAEYINERHGKMIIPKNLYDGTVKPAAELVDFKEDPIDYFAMSGICAEMIRHRASVKDIVKMFKTKKLTADFFPLSNAGKSVYELYSEKEFKTMAIDAFEKAKRSVFKSAQGAPVVIMSPRSRGFSNRETIINRYQGSSD